MRSPIPSPASALDTSAYCRSIRELLQTLFPICRSITGEGFRESLKILSTCIPLDFIEIPTGTQVFDWEVPREWTIRDAYVKNSRGDRVIDFKKSNLHVMGYSIPVKQRMTLDQLRPHLHTLPKQRHAIPYLTSYYQEDWGFCLSQEDYDLLTPGEYEVCIDSELKPGVLVLGEAVLPGETDEEILLSSYCCHPSMANNELSGPITVSMLYRYLSSLPRRRYTYRFYIGPETIGALAYLSLRGEHLKKKLAAGLVVTCCGDRGGFTYKQVRNPRNNLDKAVDHVLRHSGHPFKTLPFFPTGSDERQYCSPGFDLPIASLMRSMYGTYPEYHTSLDNLEFVSEESLYETLQMYVNVLYALENNFFYKNAKPHGEPRLSKYGLYPSMGAQQSPNPYTQRLRYLLNFSDGTHDLLDICEKLDEPIWLCEAAVQDLKKAHLLQDVTSRRHILKEFVR